MANFVAWPKIARLANEHMSISEKIDGTNACVVIEKHGEDFDIYAQSRTRIIVPGDDNYGFAAWVVEHRDTLIRDLGEGRHFGELWGRGIQRNYGLEGRKFSLFNTYQWGPKRGHFLTPNLDVVPLLWEGQFDTSVIAYAHEQLMENGSSAAPGWMKPEGVVVYLSEARVSYKWTDHAAGPTKPRTTS